MGAATWLGLPPCWKSARSRSASGPGGEPGHHLRRGPGRDRRGHRPERRGKSTLFDVVTGFTDPTPGRSASPGRVTGLRPDQINRRGIARTFQKLRPFAGMSARENVMVGRSSGRVDGRGARRGRALIALVGLGDRADAFAREPRRASASAWRWRAPWRPGRACCSWTRSRAVSTSARSPAWSP